MSSASCSASWPQRECEEGRAGHIIRKALEWCAFGRRAISTARTAPVRPRVMVTTEGQCRLDWMQRDAGWAKKPRSALGDGLAGEPSRGAFKGQAGSAVVCPSAVAFFGRADQKRLTDCTEWAFCTSTEEKKRKQPSTSVSPVVPDGRDDAEPVVERHLSLGGDDQIQTFDRRRRTRLDVKFKVPVRKADVQDATCSPPRGSTQPSSRSSPYPTHSSHDGATEPGRLRT